MRASAVASRPAAVASAGSSGLRTIHVAPDAHDGLAECRPTMRCAIAYPLMAYHQSVGGA
jgi:hypothetical protein